MPEEPGDGRLAEVTIAVSLATDLGTGQPLEHGLRTCWLALRAAQAMELGADQQSCCYHVALLRFLGCTSDAADTAVLAGGDDLTFNAAMGPMLMASPGRSTLAFLLHLAEDLPAHRRAGRVVRALADPRAGERSLAQHCEAAARLAGRMGMPADVCAALSHAFERWDGKGHPDGLAGDEVPIAVRVVTVARDVDLWSALGGWSAVDETLRVRRGRAYDPAVVDALLDGGREWLAEVGDDPRRAVLDAEPVPVLTFGEAGLDVALEAIADFADLTSPWFRGHSPGVAALAHAAARAGGLSDDDAQLVRRAALVHDVGRVGLPNGIWDRPGPLTDDQWERVRLYPYLTERVLSRCPLLEPMAAIAADHHERTDGSGYHHGRRGDQLTATGRILAAADVFHAATEHRPHRPAMEREGAAQLLLAEADAGRFTRREVDAVLAAAEVSTRPARVARPAGLTEREVDVLRLIARGRSNKEVAAALGIAPKTVGRHVEHIYAKAGVRTRAGATLFAMESGLLDR